MIQGIKNPPLTQRVVTTIELKKKDFEKIENRMTK